MLILDSWIFSLSLWLFWVFSSEVLQSYVDIHPRNHLHLLPHSSPVDRKWRPLQMIAPARPLSQYGVSLQAMKLFQPRRNPALQKRWENGWRNTTLAAKVVAVAVAVAVVHLPRHRETSGA